MSTQAVFAIMNSRITALRQRQLREALISQFGTEGFRLESTQYAGHAPELARLALQNGYTKVIAAGGDGTIHEVIQVLTNSEAELMIIPCGSGNGLARHCGIPFNMKAALQLWGEGGHTVSIDVGCINGIYFASNAGLGFDARICEVIRNQQKRGLWMYVREVWKHYLQYKPATYQLTTDGHIISLKAFMLNLANGRQFGYNFEIAPEASLQDGQLDVMVVKQMPWYATFSFVLDGWRKTLNRNKNCVYLRASQIQIRSDQLNVFQADGDAHPCEGVCEVRVEAGALRLRLPKHIKNL